MDFSQLKRAAEARGYSNVSVEGFEAGRYIGLYVEKGGLGHAIRAEGFSAKDLLDAMDEWFSEKEAA